MAGPAGHYVHSDSMDERLHAHPATLQVSTFGLACEKFSCVSYETRGKRAARGCDAERGMEGKRDERETGSDGRRKTVGGNETMTRKDLFARTHTW